MADRTLAAYLFLLTSALVSRASAGTGPPDVLVIYDSGFPSRTISEVTAADEGVMAGPTPTVTNCRTVAKQLAAALESRGLVVRVVEASAVESPKFIHQARVIVLGTPARFWNVSWRMKKLFDEQFGRIYISSKQEFATLRATAFAMAEIEPSAAAAIKAIESVIHDCGGQLDSTMVILTTHREAEVTQRVSRFADELTTLVEKTKSGATRSNP